MYFIYTHNFYSVLDISDKKVKWAKMASNFPVHVCFPLQASMYSL